MGGEPLDLLRELHAMVKGECPSLLNEDSGGNGDLALKIEDALAASPPPPSGAACGVKPLEWIAGQSMGGFYAASVCGGYFAYPDGSWTCPRQHHVVEGIDSAKRSLEDAKAAAQADYEAMIRSALTPVSTFADGVEAALRPFAEAAENLDESDLDRYSIWEHPAAMCITVGNLRAAKKALAGWPPAGDEDASS